MGEKYTDTKHLKLAALLYSEVPQARVEIFKEANFSDRKIIRVLFPEENLKLALQYLREFSECTAMANVYKYNKALNEIRNQLNGVVHVKR